MIKPKVILSVIGRFHAFNLANAFEKNKLNYRLFATLPYFRAKNFGIERSHYAKALQCEVMVRVLRKLKLFSKQKTESIYQCCFRRKLKQYVQKTDANIFIGFAGVSFDALLAAKEKGMITILERGSSHRQYQMDILLEEYKLQGVKPEQNFNIDDEVFVREMKEYEIADYISIPSSFVKKTFMEEGISKDKLLVNPYGVDLSEFKQIPKKDDVFRIIYAGGLTLQKGSHYLLQAFYELNLHNSELWHLGSINNEMQPFIDRFKSNSIIFHGHKPQGELYKYYSQGSVFILPSIQDGFGMVIFQAMSCGLPVILSENTGGYDAVSKNGEEGFIIPIRDVEAIKEKILFLYENPDLAKEMGKKAKKRVKSGFTWDDYGERYIENLKKIMS